MVSAALVLFFQKIVNATPVSPPPAPANTSPPLTPGPEGIGSGRDGSPNRQFIHLSVRLERSIAEFLSSACCYLRTRPATGPRGEPPGVLTRSFPTVPVHTRMHDFQQSRVNLCVLSFSRCSQTFRFCASAHICPEMGKKCSFLAITEPLKELLSAKATYLPRLGGCSSELYVRVDGFFWGGELTC